MIYSPYYAIFAMHCLLEYHTKECLLLSQNKNSGTNLPFASLLTSDIVAKKYKRVEEL